MAKSSVPITQNSNGEDLPAISGATEALLSGKQLTELDVVVD
jgi:hypothetical protein